MNTEKKPEKLVTIYVNGDEFEEPDGEISYDRVVDLAFPGERGEPNKMFTVTYKRGPSKNEQGSLVEGASVKIKNKMIFDVTPTTRS
ncbi:MAG: multiubiquitin domain-containing protein [Actinobacteria bacterium]|nr:multiubiquitin domain-containing protein [Actinomycetota bacterium]